MYSNVIKQDVLQVAFGVGYKAGGLCQVHKRRHPSMAERSEV